uniref:Caveolin n=1 Tax=Magallana gigas TaxID=29159 RepID=A0A8W8I6K5_MAGGI
MERKQCVRLSVLNESKMGDCALLWSVMWAVILIVFGWPIGLICALFYCLLSPCAACCHGCTELINLLDRGVKLPLTCSQNMVTGKSMC